MSWHYLQEQEEVSSAGICWDGVQFVPSKSTSMLDGYCLRDSGTDGCRGSRSGMTLRPSTDGPGVGGSMLSAGDSPANRSASRESSSEHSTAGNCSGRLFAVYKKSNPNISFSKMCLASSPVNPLHAYVGGLIDGEGCIRIQKQHGKATYIPVVQITMSDKARPILEAMTEHFGGRLYSQGYPKKQNWSSQTMWRINGAFAVEFLRMIQPYIVLKQEQCALALSLDELRQREGWTDSTRLHAAKLKKRMHELNTRGPVQNVGGFYDPMPNLFGTWEPFSGPFPRWGTMRNGELSERTTPELCTSGIESGLWATPCAQPANGEPEVFLERKRRSVARGNKMGVSLTDLNMQVKAAERGMWPRPNVPNGGRSVTHVTDWRGKSAYHNGKKVQVGLESAVKLWATPAARDSKGANSREHCEVRGTGRKHMDQLANQVAHPDLAGIAGMHSTTTCLDGMDAPTAAGKDLVDEVDVVDRGRLWQTPVADDAVDREAGKVNSRGEPKLSARVKLWPTPMAGAETYSAQGGIQLHQRVKQFPTPTKADGTGGPGRSDARTGGDNLRTVVNGSLNPDWVEWLMGWPIGWTRLEPLVGMRWEPLDVEPADVPRVATGVPNRAARLRCIGNGQVPQALVVAWKTLCP